MQTKVVLLLFFYGVFLVIKSHFWHILSCGQQKLSYLTLKIYIVKQINIQ